MLFFPSSDQKLFSELLELGTKWIKVLEKIKFYKESYYDIISLS